MPTIPLLLAQAAPPPAAVPAAISVGLVFGLVILCWLGTKVWSWRWTQIVAGVCLGVVGANGFVGDLARMLIGIGVRAFQAIQSGFS